MIEIRLPYPPSVNHYWIKRKGRKGLCLSERAKVFRSLVAVQALKFLTAHKEIRDRDPVLRGNVELWMMVCPPDNRKRDFDNLLKATLDALVHAGLIEDDSKIKKASIWMMAKDPEKQGYVDIMLDQLGDDYDAEVRRKDL